MISPRDYFSPDHSVVAHEILVSTATVVLPITLLVLLVTACLFNTTQPFLRLKKNDEKDKKVNSDEKQLAGKQSSDRENSSSEELSTTDGATSSADGSEEDGPAVAGPANLSLRVRELERQLADSRADYTELERRYFAGAFRRMGTTTSSSSTSSDEDDLRNDLEAVLRFAKGVQDSALHALVQDAEAQREGLVDRLMGDPLDDTSEEEEDEKQGVSEGDAQSGRNNLTEDGRGGRERLVGHGKKRNESPANRALNFVTPAKEFAAPRSRSSSSCSVESGVRSGARNMLSNILAACSPSTNSGAGGGGRRVLSLHEEATAEQMLQTAEQLAGHGYTLQTVKFELDRLSQKLAGELDLARPCLQVLSRFLPKSSPSHLPHYLSIMYPPTVSLTYLPAQPAISLRVLVPPLRINSSPQRVEII